MMPDFGKEQKMDLSCSMCKGLMNLIPVFRCWEQRCGTKKKELDMQGNNAGLPHHIFIYGTLKKGQPNYHHFLNSSNGQAEFIMDACTAFEWPLIIATKFNLPFLLHAQGRGKKIHGEIFHVDDKMLEFMDEFEGHPDVYEREKVTVVIKNAKASRETSPLVRTTENVETIECWTYFLKKYPHELLERPTYPLYDTNGNHERPYVVSEDLSSADDVWNALKEA